MSTAAQKAIELIEQCQAVLAAHLPPDGTSETQTINELLGLLDCPNERDVLAALRATPTPEQP